MAAFDAGALSAPFLTPSAGTVAEKSEEDPQLAGLDEPGTNPKSEEKADLDTLNACFECNICLELAHDPVVTQCGHLHCWPCLYKWLQLHSECKQCPVCKAGVAEDKVIPLYGRGSSGTDPRKKAILDPNVPCRPQGLRMPVQRSLGIPGVAPGNVPVSGFGLMPSIFGFGLQFGIGGTTLQGEPMSPEQQQQAFLSRLLLMLGSFVIMCLLIF